MPSIGSRHAPALTLPAPVPDPVPDPVPGEVASVGGAGPGPVETVDGAVIGGAKDSQNLMLMPRMPVAAALPSVPWETPMPRRNSPDPSARRRPSSADAAWASAESASTDTSA